MPRKKVPSELKELAKLCKRMGLLKQELAILELRAAVKKEELRELTDETVPTYMSEIGWSEATLADGRKVQIIPIVRGHISEEKSKKALAWLRKHDAGDIIKNTVTVTFGKGEEKAARAFVRALDKELNYKQKTNVHPQTLNKYIREVLADAGELDRDLLGVYVGSTTKIGDLA